MKKPSVYDIIQTDQKKAGNIEAFVAKQQEILGQDSRILVRCSGTEPLIRIMMIERPDKLLIKKNITRIN